MATVKVDIGETNITASQLSEFFRLAALPESHVNRASLQDYLEARVIRQDEVSGSMVNLAEFFVTSDALYVDPDFISRIDLSPCVDTRKLSFICPPLPRRMSDTAINVHAGGKGTLCRRRATPVQLKREAELAINGGDSIFKKGGYYLLYLEGRGGDLCPVLVFWRRDRLDLNCCRFDGRGGWNEGYQVCGN